jgi:uncharacterized UBP type Zn finger protein
MNDSTSQADGCIHIPAVTAAAQGDACQECGSRVNVRLCATCGHVGCCESQAGHGRIHALTEGHPVIFATPAAEGWMWCYEESAYIG